MANISDLLGKTLIEIRQVDDDGDELWFITDNGEVYRMYHSQDCCESVTIDDISGNLGDLLNNPILLAEESTSEHDNSDNEDNNEDYGDSQTWTFYRLATVKGYVDIKWYGESNGYYSESVDFKKQR